MSTRNEQAAEYLANVRARMKEQKISGAMIARHLGVSASWVNLMLRGDCPYSGACGWTKYLDEYFTGFLGLPEFIYKPEG